MDSSPPKPAPDPKLTPSTSVNSTSNQRELARDEKLAEFKAQGYKGPKLNEHMQIWFSNTEYYKALDAQVNARFDKNFKQL